MTTVSWRRGFKNAVVCLIGLLVVTGVVAIGISTLTGQAFRASWAIAWAIIVIATAIWFFTAFLIGRRKMGAILLDCGPHSGRWLFLLNAVLFTFGGLGSGFVLDSFGRTASVLFGLSFSVYWVAMAFGRLQVVENGIWQYVGLLKWEKIKSFAWREGYANSTLMLQAKTKLPFFGRGALPVSTANRAAVNELLEKYVEQKEA